jgi:drug/metabolite transporter (DMT)-like permease
MKLGPQPQSLVMIVGMAALALIAFAANSVLCRMALLDGSIAPASFTAVRVMSGAVTLVILMALRGNRPMLLWPNWAAGASLFVYMVFFSFAYIALGAGIGALVLFGFVQLTMISVAIALRNPFPPMAWLGFVMSIIGVVFLVRPGSEAPDLFSSFQMALAGMAWGVYSVIGKNSKNPLNDTANNFILCVPPVVLLVIAFWPEQTFDPTGLVLAITSGGYTIWYWCLPLLKTLQAAVLQLSVPVIAAVGGVIILDEEITLRLSISSVLVLGGIAIVMTSRSQNNEPSISQKWPRLTFKWGFGLVQLALQSRTAIKQYVKRGSRNED